jgi:hypothetical protein
MISIAELKRPELALRWDEAVALVAEVSNVVLTRGLARVPGSESIILLPDGTLRLLQDGPLDGAPVQRLGAMLDNVLSATACPAELKQLAAASMANPPAYATVQAFAEALAFFERPVRHDLLKAIADRASDLELEARANRELEHLQTRARNTPATAVAQARNMSPQTRRYLLLSGAAAVLLGVLAGGVFALNKVGPSHAGITERLRARVDRIAQKGLEAIGVTPRAPSTPTPVVTTPPRVASHGSRRQAPKIPESVSVAEMEVWTTSDIPKPSESISPEPAVGDQTIYTDDEENVEPAVLMRPQLPSDPPSSVADDDIGVLEIIVSATGAVEHVRLISEANRYHDRMIVAAAKAWWFEPATKDGRPVRYRTHIRVTL